MKKRRIAIKEVIEYIGDEIGNQYNWFLIGFEAHWAVDKNEQIISNIFEKINKETLGYYKVSWELLIEIATVLSAVVVFDLVGFKKEEDFFKERKKLNPQEDDWTGFICDFEFYIYDGEIWEINGTDEFLVDKIKTFFSPLPIFLI